MVWQENVSQIVMLTNVTEGKKVNFDNCCSESVMIYKFKEPDQETF